MTEIKQIPLAFKFRDEISISGFHTGLNGHVLNHLQQLSDSGDSTNFQDRLIFCWGESGCGKSYLLQAFCKQLHESGKTVSYFSCKHIDDIQPAMLEGLDKVDLLAIDDIDTVAGDEIWELALFGYLRRWSESPGMLLLSAVSKPTDIQFRLPDLKSRLSGWPVVYQLHTLQDSDKLKVLQNYAKTRGLEFGDEVGNYMLTRFPRNLKSMLDLLEKADIAAMSQQRKLTIPFLKTLIKTE